MYIQIVELAQQAQIEETLNRSFKKAGIVKVSKAENRLLRDKGIAVPNGARKRIEDKVGLSYAQYNESKTMKAKLFEEWLHGVKKTYPNWGLRVPDHDRHVSSTMPIQGNTAVNKAYDLTLKRQRSEVVKYARQVATQDKSPKWSTNTYLELATMLEIKVHKGKKFDQQNKKWVNTLIHPTERVTEVFRYPADIDIAETLSASWTTETEAFSLIVNKSGIKLTSVNILPILRSKRTVQGETHIKYAYLPVYKANVSKEILNDWADLHEAVSSLPETNFSISKSGILTVHAHSVETGITEKIKAITPEHKKYVGSYRYIEVSYNYNKITYLKMGKKIKIT